MREQVRPQYLHHRTQRHTSTLIPGSTLEGFSILLLSQHCYWLVVIYAPRHSKQEPLNRYLKWHVPVYAIERRQMSEGLSRGLQYHYLFSHGKIALSVLAHLAP